MYTFKSIISYKKLPFNQDDEWCNQIRLTHVEFDQYAPYFLFQGKNVFRLVLGERLFPFVDDQWT